jgi:endonuclease III
MASSSSQNVPAYSQEYIDGLRDKIATFKKKKDKLEAQLEEYKQRISFRDQDALTIEESIKKLLNLYKRKIKESEEKLRVAKSV